MKNTLTNRILIFAGVGLPSFIGFRFGLVPVVNSNYSDAVTVNGKAYWTEQMGKTKIVTDTNPRHGLGQADLILYDNDNNGKVDTTYARPIISSSRNYLRRPTKEDQDLFDKVASQKPVRKTI